ncbi:complex III assembly factor LYRM7-like [Saccostrea echinata]|uniref:complex III assembly factor LYRM7-like n=1 Tax=Saccostrea echinata TaxID=191078 RepID=UPI002A83B98B|nr:complex III assembly factor LYRM7-like [Saccostrea echinata]XP_061188103.1 complex III assembly factor LYRM7-like [Saccostrea echinata]
MAQTVTRSQILSIFKKLHRVRQRAFKNDDLGLKVCRERINNGFRENRNVTSEEEISKLYKTAEEVEMVMRTQLVQLEKVDEKTFRMNIREETHKRPNYLFNPDAVIPIEKRTRKSRKCEEIKQPKGS